MKGIRAAMAVVVGAAHCAALCLCTAESAQTGRPAFGSMGAPMMVAELLEDASKETESSTSLQRASRIRERSVEVNLLPLRFEERSEKSVSGVAPVISPRLDMSVRIDIAPFVERAHLRPGETVTVIVDVEVLPDGSVGNVVAAGSKERPEVIAAAVAYAKAAHWIPGALLGNTMAMHIWYPIVLFRAA